MSNLIDGPETPATTDTPAPAAPSTIETLIDQWHVESFANSAISRSTDAWNTVSAAIPVLKQRIAALIKEA